MRSPFHWWDRTVSLAEQRGWGQFLERLALLRRLAEAAEIPLNATAGETACPETPRVFERHPNASWIFTPTDLAPLLEAEFAAEAVARAHRFASVWEARVFPIALKRLGNEKIVELLRTTSATEPLPSDRIIQATPVRLRTLWSEVTSLPEVQLPESLLGAERWNGAVPGRLSDRGIEGELPCCLDLAELESDADQAALASQVRHLRMLERLRTEIRRSHPLLISNEGQELRCDIRLVGGVNPGERCRLEIRSRE